MFLGVPLFTHQSATARHLDPSRIRMSIDSDALGSSYYRTASWHVEWNRVITASYLPITKSRSK